MTASGGGMGVHFKKPSTWLIFQSKRYTLELIQKEQTYTLSYFSEKYRDQVMFLGKISGRNNTKMEEVKLNSIRTPSGKIAYEEANLIIECKLTQISTAYAEDFYSEESKNYLSEVYKNPDEIRKYVFGEITNVWVKKQT